MSAADASQVDSQLFRDVLSRWASGITVVTCRTAAGAPHGMTANAFCSVSLIPPLILVCIDHRHQTHGRIEQDQVFGVHILGHGMQEISDRCAGFRGEAGHNLSDLACEISESGVPILRDAICWMECGLWRSYDGGDHTIFVGEVRRAAANEGEPLLWFNRGYHRVKHDAP